MRVLITIPLLIFFFLPEVGLHAQISQPGRPWPLHYHGLKKVPVVDLPLPAEKKEAVREEQNAGSRHKNDEFGTGIKVSFDFESVGIWDTLDNGWKLGRLGIRSADAASLSLIFTGYQLEKGVRVFLYDTLLQHVLGAFTHLNNKPYGLLAIEPLPGDLLIIEMQVPPFLSQPGILEVGYVGHEHKREARYKNAMDKYFGLSGACNPDILCYEDSVYLLVKNAVVRVVYAGKERCTGTLLNNARGDARPLIITAGHCISSEWLANTAVYFFDYVSPYCSGPDGRNHKSVSGGTLKATTDNKLDFSLIELSEDIPFHYHPFFAGWDATGEATDGGFCIHHPQGDVKKIGIDEQIQTTGNFGEGYNTNTHWLVGEWEAGTTEKGSSGASLFNRNGLVIGNLSGGDACCDNSVNDYFQKVSHAWADYPDSTQQLKYWLDPLGISGKLSRGLDPYASFWLTGDTLSNIEGNETLSLSGTGLSWGYVSGHNSDLVETFGEGFRIEGKKYILGVMAEIARAYATSDTTSVIISIRQGNDAGNPPLIQEELALVDFVGHATHFIEFDSVVSVRDTFFIGFSLDYDTPLDTFALYHALREPQENNTAWLVEKGTWIPMNDAMAYNQSVSLAVFPVVYDSLPDKPTVEDPVFEHEMTVYPNPTEQAVWIKFRNPPAGEILISLYDLTGRKIYSGKFQMHANPLYIDFGNKTTGVCLLQVVNGQYIENQKIMFFR